MDWNQKPYYSLDFYLKQTYGEKIYRLALNGGMNCPNRDGMVGTGGCIFCSAGGSGDFAASHLLSITEQIEQEKKKIQKKRHCNHYIAYFQAYTNTYAPVETLRLLFTEAISHPDIVILSIATRPDCLGKPVLDLLEELNQIKPVWVELGLQTMHNKTADFIHRGYPLFVYEDAVMQLKKRHLTVITHIILGLPYETNADMLSTISYLNQIGCDGIKLQLLHILRGTQLAELYQKQLFSVLTQEEYLSILIQCIEQLSPDIVIHRVTGDGPKDLLLAPLWSQNKRGVLNSLHREMKLRGAYQGRSLLCQQKY